MNEHLTQLIIQTSTTLVEEQYACEIKWTTSHHHWHSHQIHLVCLYNLARLVINVYVSKVNSSSCYSAETVVPCIPRRCC